MHKSIELGRAVLSTSTTNFELWLKTLITISPQQECTNLEQYNATSLLDLLSSGETWVGRGNGLYIDLDLSFKGQPLADEQLRRLSEALLAGPVWNQLNLQPSLPYETLCEPGRLRVTVNHSSEHAVSAVKQRHRILSNVSAADVRPPEGVSTLFLDSISLSMDIFETVQRKRVTTVKRLKKSTNTDDLLQATTDLSTEYLERGALDELTQNVEGMGALPASSSSLKRNRSPASALTSILLLPVTPPGETSKECRRTTTIFDSKSTPSFDVADLHTLVDGALRLSVTTSINSKSLPGIKVKANTFGPGLAEVAPILWKPGYLLSLSQRASLLPVVSRSLSRPPTIGKIRSTSLKGKLSALTTSLPFYPTTDQRLDQGLEMSDENLMSLAVTCQLWLHLQKNSLCKSTTPLQSFMTNEPLFTIHCQSDDMLEQSWQEGEEGHRSKPSEVGPHGSGVPGDGQIASDHPATRAACRNSSSGQYILRALAAPGYNPGDADDELLLGDECFEPLSPATNSGNETSQSQNH